MAAVPPGAGPAADPDARLKEALRARCLLVDEEEGFTLTSGKHSPYLLNVKNLFGDPEAAALVTDRLLDVLAELSFDLVAGVELGGVLPLACVVEASHRTDRPVPGFVVRKEAKGHGTGNRIEGLPEPPSSGRVVVLEDVTTTGGSVLSVVKHLRGLGLTVEEAVVVVDRQEGAQEALAADGVRLVPLVLAEELLPEHLR